MGVGEWFKSFCENIVVQEAATISQRYRAMTRRLNTDFWDTVSDTAHSLYVGSYGRNTAIDFSDIDMIMELPSDLYYQYDKYVTNGQSALLQAVKTSIERTYSRTYLRADGQVIQVPFTDGINFEVVPVFNNKAGSYTFPNANNGGSWQTTNPRPEISAVRTRNAACNNNLIPLCRMMRAWKGTWDVPIGGLLIDTLAYQFIENNGYREKSYLYYDFMCRDFFDWMAGQDANQEYWKAPGSGQYVYGKGLFQYKARRCCNIALSAIAYADKNQEWAAKRDWRDIFGTAFPD
jgi:Second Messenger Oligonucleotide or Dinucleotide Synthetase domain